MSEVSIITNDEIMEMTQLVFDRYYTELKRQLRRGEIPTEEAEQYCTEILSKVYQTLQMRKVAATSYEMDACAIPIINEELRRILVPLHLNGYRNLRENPITEKVSSTENVVEEETVAEEFDVPQNVVAEVKENEIAEVKKEAVQVVSNGEVQVFPEDAENELNPELRTEIRRILQQEFQLEPAQVKPVVVVVNVTAPQAVAQTEAVAQTAVAQETIVQEAAVQRAVEQEAVAQRTVVQETIVQEAVMQEPVVQDVVVQEATVSVMTVQQEAEAEFASACEENIEDNSVEVSEEALNTESESSVEQMEESNHLGMWAAIILLLLLLLWLTTGMLMSYDIIPDINLGYEWFNRTFFELF